MNRGGFETKKGGLSYAGFQDSPVEFDFAAEHRRFCRFDGKKHQTIAKRVVAKCNNPFRYNNPSVS